MRETDFCDGCCYRHNCNKDLEKCCYLVNQRCIVDQPGSFITLKK